MLALASLCLERRGYCDDEKLSFVSESRGQI